MVISLNICFFIFGIYILLFIEQLSKIISYHKVAGNFIPSLPSEGGEKYNLPLFQKAPKIHNLINST